MFPTIHSYKADDLQTQGFGALSDCLSCTVTEELNGAYTLELNYPLNGLHADFLLPGNIIMAKPNHVQTQQPFRISQIKRSFSNNITVYANHICYDLSGYPCRGAASYASLSALISAMNAMTWSTGAAAYHAFNFQTDISSNADFAMEGVQTLRSWMGGQEGSIIDTYGGEWEYDNFNCYLKARRGRDTGYRISYGKNLAEYEKQKDFNEYSHVCAYWKKSETLVYGSLVETGLSCAFRCSYYDASSMFEDEPSVAQLDTIALSRIPTLNIGAQTITVTPAQIGNDVIGLGDSVLICFESVFETRVIKTTWNVLLGAYDKLELGNKKAGITDTIKSLSEGSGSTPNEVDFVVEENITANSGYTKWSSGKMECWIRVSRVGDDGVQINSSWGGIYYGTIGAVTYPKAFLEYPITEITVQAAGGNFWAVPSYDNYSETNTGTIYAYRPSSGGATKYAYTVNVKAVGRWR